MKKSVIAVAVTLVAAMSLSTSAFASAALPGQPSRIASNSNSNAVSNTNSNSGFVILDFGYSAKVLEGGKTEYTKYDGGDSGKNDGSSSTTRH